MGRGCRRRWRGRRGRAGWAGKWRWRAAARLRWRCGASEGARPGGKVGRHRQAGAVRGSVNVEAGAGPREQTRRWGEPDRGGPGVKVAWISKRSAGGDASDGARDCRGNPVPGIGPRGGPGRQARRESESLGGPGGQERRRNTCAGRGGGVGRGGGGGGERDDESSSGAGWTGRKKARGRDAVTAQVMGRHERGADPAAKRRQGGAGDATMVSV